MHGTSPKRPSGWQFLLLVALCVICKPSMAETFDVEVDPADFLMGGYRVHAGYVRSPLRYDVGILNVEIPSLLLGNDKFDYQLFGVVGRVDYLFRSYDGVFVGLEGTQMRIRYHHKPSDQIDTRYPFLLATRIGYRFEFFQHLTLTPWLGLGVMLNKGSDYVSIDQDKFKVSTFNAFPTVHLGWAF